MDVAYLQRIALGVAGALSSDRVLAEIVEGLGAEPDVALARIWLIAPGDVCSDCLLRPECIDQTRCLHLKASAGRSVANPEECWTCTDGRFQRMPLQIRKVGRIGANGKAELLHLGQGNDDWLADAAWAQREDIKSFAGQPLVFRDEVLGVLGLFSRREISDEDFGWLRTFADHAAVALANARAYEEVQHLRAKLELERDYLREEIKSARAFGGIVGASAGIQKVLHQIELVAPTDATVLIQGESGTGKELIARAIHERSDRRDRPLVSVNCASIPADLFESEFFGHVQGAFTGAAQDRAGRFQVADGGTLFLDEIGEIPLELQGKLLRALQEGRFSRVGEDEERSVDVRTVAATNRKLEREVAAGRFREDLYYRLTVFPLTVPPLRERSEDVPALAAHFLDQAARRRPGRPTPSLTKGDAEVLMAYEWPGNIRELQNVIERSLILSTGPRLKLDLGQRGAKAEENQPAAVASTTTGDVLTDVEIRGLARANMLKALERCSWKVSGRDGAAALLGLRPNTLASRMKTLGIEKPRW